MPFPHKTVQQLVEFSKNMWVVIFVKRTPIPIVNLCDFIYSLSCAYICSQLSWNFITKITAKENQKMFEFVSNLKLKHQV